MPRRADRRRIYAKRYKTDLCRTFVDSGFCPYGANCLFAHGAEEMRSQELNVIEGLTVDVISRISRQKIRESHLNGGGSVQQQTDLEADCSFTEPLRDDGANGHRAETATSDDATEGLATAHSSQASLLQRTSTTSDAAVRARKALRQLWRAARDVPAPSPSGVKEVIPNQACTREPGVAAAATAPRLEFRAPRRDPYISAHV